MARAGAGSQVVDGGGWTLWAARMKLIMFSRGLGQFERLVVGCQRPLHHRHLSVAQRPGSTDEKINICQYIMNKLSFFPLYIYIYIYASLSLSLSLSEWCVKVKVLYFSQWFTQTGLRESPMEMGTASTAEPLTCQKTACKFSLPVRDILYFLWYEI